MGDRTGETIELGDDEGITLAAEIDGRLQLSAASDRGDLLAEQLPAPERGEITDLGVEAGLLFEGRGTRVPTSMRRTGPCSNRFKNLSVILFQNSRYLLLDVEQSVTVPAASFH